MPENFKSTKFWMNLIALLGAYFLVWAGKVEARDWMTMAVAASGIYTAGNVIEKFK